jgi:aldose 1-epimerase
MNRTLILAGLILLLAPSCINKKQPSENQKKSSAMTVTKRSFGSLHGEEVHLFTLSNNAGFTVEITNYGGIVTSIITPDKNGNFDDVALGYDSLNGYLIETPYFGAIVGRVANRISGSQFTLDGKTYKLASNVENNHLHGGLVGFDKVLWKAETQIDDTTASLKLSYVSPDGEEGYPGNLSTTVVYTITRDNKLQIEYTATTDKPTPVNLSHHSYFNLSGTSGKNILDHVLYIDADRYTAIDSNLLPTGKLAPVENTPLDFRVPERIGSRIHKVPGGYDHNYVLNNKGQFAKVAELYDEQSGRFMEVFTTEPGMQFYSGNFLNGSIVGEKGLVYQKHHGLCLETQHFPDAPNQPDFPSIILRPGETYKQFTVYRFGVKK